MCAGCFCEDFHPLNPRWQLSSCCFLSGTGLDFAVHSDLIRPLVMLLQPSEVSAAAAIQQFSPGVGDMREEEREKREGRNEWKNAPSGSNLAVGCPSPSRRGERVPAADMCRYIDQRLQVANLLGSLSLSLSLALSSL